jgi:hypothetical protein
MAEIKKLSVEQTLNKIRSDEAVKSRSERRDAEMDTLDEEIKRMRAQRLSHRAAPAQARLKPNTDVTGASTAAPRIPSR